MLMRRCGLSGAVFFAFLLQSPLWSEGALAQDRRQECSARYKTAKAEGTLAGLTWPQFFSRCMAELKAMQEQPVETRPTAAVPEPVNPLKEEPVPSAAEAPAPAQPAAPLEAVTAAPPVPEATSPTAPAVPEPAPVEPPAAAIAPPENEATSAPREPVFPTAVNPAYAKDKPNVARRKTCQDQFNANKATDSNGGLKWTQKGGGYQTECIKRLKDAS